MNIQKNLKRFAFSTAYPYIAQQPTIKEFFNSISFLLVGSTATGLCTEHSDVDICLLCPQNVFDIIATDTQWKHGRPTEVIIDGTQLHYYAISFETVIQKIMSFDDITLYVYGTAEEINDNAKLFSEIKKRIASPELKEARKLRSLDILIRRNRALKQVLLQEKDPICRLRICIELIEHLLSAIALRDDLQFDKRKRLYFTSLKGEHGMMLESKIHTLMSHLGSIGNSENTVIANDFLDILNNCIDYIK